MAYQPGVLSGNTVDDLRRSVAEELTRIADALETPSAKYILLDTLQAALDKPRAGAIAVSAAGVLGVNAGVYWHNGTSWTQL